MPRYTDAQKTVRQTRKESWDNVLGFVTKVYEHDGTEDGISNHEVNVQLKHRAEEFKRVPVHTDHNGSIYVPEKNDMVEVGFLSSQSQRPIVVNVVYTDENRAPLARSGHFRREFEAGSGDPLYIESEPKGHGRGQGNVVRFAKKEDGLSNAGMAIELDNSGGSPVASIRKNGTPDSNQTPELSVGIDNGGPTAFIRADPNDDTVNEAYIEMKQDGTIDIYNEQDKDTTIEHDGTGSVVVDHTGDGGISVENSSSGEITVTNDASANIVVKANNGDLDLEAPSGDAQLDGSSVTLGAGGTDVIKDITVNTTEDSDGHVTSVSLDITRSSVVSTE